MHRNRVNKIMTNNNINEEVNMKKRKTITLIDLMNAALTQGATT